MDDFEYKRSLKFRREYIQSKSLPSNQHSNMKAIAVLFALISVAVAVEVIPVLARSDVRDASGQFSHSYQSGDGTYLAEQGKLVPTADGKDYVLVKEGSYKFLTPEGRTIELKYVADGQGFRPVGAHLPVSVVA